MTLDEQPIQLVPEEDTTPRRTDAIRAIAEVGVPDLKGTPDEVTRGREIRLRFLVEADELLTRLRTNATLTQEQSDTAIVAPQQVRAEEVHVAQVALNRLRHQDNATWWIAHEEDRLDNLLRSFQ